MAKRGQDFGRAVLAIEGDDSQLRATLQRDEALTRQSAAKMQANLAPLTVGVTELGASADVAASSVGVLASVAAATGSASVMTAAQIGVIGSSLKTLGNQALGATAQLKALASASLAFMATGLGIALAAIAAAVGVAAIAWRSHNKELAEANRLAEEGRKAFESSFASIQKQNQALAKRLFLARGADPLTLEIAAIKGRIANEDDLFLKQELRFSLTMLQLIQEEQQTKKMAAQEQAADTAKRVAAQAALDIALNTRTATADRIGALDQEIAILKGIRTANFFIADDIERQKAATRDRLASEKALNDALAARVGPQTAGEAAKLVANELRVLKAQEKRNALLSQRIAQELRLGNISKEQFATLQKIFGLEKGRIAFGPAALSTFRQVSLSRTALGGPGSQKVQQVADKAAVAQLKGVRRDIRNQVPRAG